MSSLAVVLGKLAYLYVEEDPVTKKPIVHNTITSRIIDIHGREDIITLNDKEAHHLFQAILDDAVDYSLIRVAFDAYVRDHAAARKGPRRTCIATMSKWLANFGNDDPPVPSLTACTLDPEELIEEWKELRQGVPRDIFIRRSCLLQGRSVHSGLWFDLKGTHRIQFKKLSLRQIAHSSIRSSCPVILSWFESVQRRGQPELRQCFGLAKYFFRYDFTSACQGQAYVCMDVLPHGGQFMHGLFTICCCCRL
jgi:hypothetical protein